MGGMAIPDEARSPWAGCRDAIAAAVVTGGDDNDDARWSFCNVGRDGKEETTSLVVNVDVDEDDDDGGIVVVVVDRDEERGGGGGEDAAAVLVRCGCPTVDGWAVAELDAYGKRLAADAKRAAKKKKGGGGGGGGKRGVATTTAATNGDGRDGGGRGKRDDSAVESRDGRNGPENDVDYPPARGVHLICGERKHDSAGTLHPCDFNPVSFDPECHSVGRSHPPKTAFS
jgi:hypothetical protein